MDTGGLGALLALIAHAFLSIMGAVFIAAVLSSLPEKWQAKWHLQNISCGVVWLIALGVFLLIRLFYHPVVI